MSKVSSTARARNFYIKSMVVGDLKEMESQVELQCKVKEDALKQLKKSQQQCKEATRDAEEARSARDELAASSKDAERKVKTLEADLIQVTEDLASSERAKRAAEAERDELQEEINSNANKGKVFLAYRNCGTFILFRRYTINRRETKIGGANSNPRRRTGRGTEQ